MMKRFGIVLLLFGAFFMLALQSTAQYQDTGVRAVAQDTVNVRAYPSTDAEILGQLEVGIEYAVVARHEFYPWVLLANVASLRPVGWAFRDIVSITGNLTNVPFSDALISNAAPTATTQQSTTNVVSTQAPQSPTPNFSVTGIAQGEINVRYGPGVDYPRVGVAQAGQRFEVTGYHTQFPWVQIRFEESPTGYAWIAIDLLVIEGDIFSTERITTTVFDLPTLTPTPAVVQSVAGLGDAGTPLSPEFAALGNRLYALALGLGFDPETSQFGSLFVYDLQTNEAITFGNNVAYSGTSVNKISILASLYSNLTGVPQQGLATDIANTMICSENASTNRVLAAAGDGDEWLGAQRTTDLMRAIGLENSYLLAPYTVGDTPPLPPAPIPVPVTNVNQTIAFPEPYNQVTVEDMGLLMTAIYQCGYEEAGPLIENFPEGTFEPRECRQMIHVMASNTVDGLLRAGVPEDTRVAHKHGWIDDTHMNAGIFFTEGGNYVVSMALHSNRIDATGNRYLAFGDTLPVFAESSRQIYNYFNPDNQMAAVREGFIPEAPSCNFANTPLITDIMSPIWDD